MTHAALAHTHTHTQGDSHSLTQSPLWSSRALPLSLSRMHTLCKLLLLTHPSTFVAVVVVSALNSTKKKKRKMSRPQNQNHDATKATTTTTTAGVALFIVAVVVVVVFRIIVRYVLFVARYKTSLSRRCLCLLRRRRRLSLVFSFNFVYFEFSQNFLEFLLHSHSLQLYGNLLLFIF